MEFVRKVTYTRLSLLLSDSSHFWRPASLSCHARYPPGLLRSFHLSIFTLIPTYVGRKYALWLLALVDSHIIAARIIPKQDRYCWFFVSPSCHNLMIWLIWTMPQNVDAKRMSFSHKVIIFICSYKKIYLLFAVTCVVIFCCIWQGRAKIWECVAATYGNECKGLWHYGRGFQRQKSAAGTSSRFWTGINLMACE